MLQGSHVNGVANADASITRWSVYMAIKLTFVAKQVIVICEHLSTTYPNMESVVNAAVSTI